MREREVMIIDAPGSVRGQMWLATSISSCGEITDGVAMGWVVNGVEQAGWVIDFADLRRWYEANAERRGLAPEPAP